MQSFLLIMGAPFSGSISFLHDLSRRYFQIAVRIDTMPLSLNFIHVCKELGIILWPSISKKVGIEATATVQSIMEEAPFFFLRTEGSECPKEQAHKDLTALPPGTNKNKKLFFFL